MKPLPIVLAAALLVTGGAANAQSASDARCLVLATGFANQATDAKQQKIAEDTLYFYLGRVAAQPNSAELKATLDAQSKSISDANAATLMAECVSAVKSKVQLLQTLARPTTPTDPQGR
jgi:hypothetical protein